MNKFIVYYYSAKTRSFYPSCLYPLYLKEGSWPPDATKISEEDYLKFKTSPPEGFELGSSEEGKPRWVKREQTCEEFIEVCNNLISNTLRVRPVYNLPVSIGVATKGEEDKDREVSMYLISLSRCKTLAEGGEKTTLPEKPSFL